MSYLGCGTLGRGCKGGGTTGPVGEGWVGWSSRNVRQAALFPALEEWHPSTLSNLPTSRECNPLPLSDLTFKGLKQLAQDFPITQVTWVTPLSLETWKIQSQTISQFLRLAECISLSPPPSPSLPPAGKHYPLGKSAGGGTVQVGRCREELRRVRGARGWVARRVPLPQSPCWALGAVGSLCGQCPRELGEEGKSGERGSRLHTPGA